MGTVEDAEGAEDTCVGLDGKTYRLVRDAEAGFVRVEPMPSVEELSAFYEDYFYSERPKFNDSAREVRDRDREYVNWGFSDVLDQFRILAGRLPRNVLDIGCGYGHALDFFKTQGISGVGFEPSSEAVSHCRSLGHDVKHGNAEALLVNERQRFDLIVANHVLEHVPDPFGLLQAIGRVMSPNGLLYVQVPNDFSGLQRIAAGSLNLEPWWLCPPNHLTYFSAQSLTRTLEMNGFSVETVWTDFPMEFFLLQGHDYVSEPALGREAHLRRLAFERAFREAGEADLLLRLYRKLAELGFGRELHVLARQTA